MNNSQKQTEIPANEPAQDYRDFYGKDFYNSMEFNCCDCDYNDILHNKTVVVDDDEIKINHKKIGIWIKNFSILGFELYKDDECYKTSDFCGLGLHLITMDCDKDKSIDIDELTQVKRQKQFDDDTADRNTANRQNYQ